MHDPREETPRDALKPKWDERYDLNDTLLATIGLTEQRVFVLKQKFENPFGERACSDRALFYFLLRARLSAHDAVTVRWSDAVEAGEKSLIFTLRGRNGKVRYAAPGYEAVDYIRAYHTGFLGRSDLLFVSLPDRAKSNQRHPLTTRGLRKIISSWK